MAPITSVGGGRVLGGAFTPDELNRYSRHLLLSEIGLAGQGRLRDARVALVGVGGLGSPCALYLAAAGVGTLGMFDADVVDVSNLQRQVLYGTRDVGRQKVQAASERLRDLNPHVRLEAFATPLTAANALEVLCGFDVVVDGTDNFATRYVTNDACVLLGIPNVYGSVFRFEGQVAVFAAQGGPCYRCLFPEPPPLGMVPSCAEGGVLGVLPGLVGTLQATEVLKLILDVGEPLVGSLLVLDTLRGDMRRMRVRRDPSCPMCGTRVITTVSEFARACGADPVGRADVPNEEPAPEIAPRELAARGSAGAAVYFVDVRELHEWQVVRVQGARHVPLATLAEAAPTLPRDRDIVVYCKAGARSARAVRTLQDAGFSRVWSLSGGVDACLRDVGTGLCLEQGAVVEQGTAVPKAGC